MIIAGGRLARCIVSLSDLADESLRPAALQVNRCGQCRGECCCEARDSKLSLWSKGSLLSIASTDSFLSIGSVGSLASIGSVGSAASAFSIGSAASTGSVLSAAARSSVLSAAQRGAILGHEDRRAGFVAGGILALAAVTVALRA